MNFTSGDLGLAIGKADATISGIRNIDRSWNITMTIYDKYDFDEIRKPWNNFENFANNIGYFMQSAGKLTPYEWDVTFSFTYQE